MELHTQFQRICWTILRYDSTINGKKVYALQSLCTELCQFGFEDMPNPSILQVDLVCHGKTEVFPDRDGSDPYAVSA